MLETKKKRVGNGVVKFLKVCFNKCFSAFWEIKEVAQNSQKKAQLFLSFWYSNMAALYTTACQEEVVKSKSHHLPAAFRR